MRHAHRLPAQNGYILLPVVLLVALVAVVAFMLNHETALDSGITESHAEAARAEYVARAGLQHTAWVVQNSGCTGDLTLASTPFGGDSYQATVDSAATATVYSVSVDADTWIKESTPGQVNGTDAKLSVKAPVGDGMRTLYHFDLAAIPAGARIESATAWFYVEQNDSVGVVNLHEVTDAWTEAAATWSSMASRYDSVVVATIPAQDSTDVWIQVNLTGLVQGWVSGNPNNGVMLIAASGTDESRFTSREWATGSERPRMVVVASAGPASPVRITATGTLSGNPSPANDINRTLTRTAVTAHQPPSFHLFQPDATRGKDAYIWEWEPTYNYGTADETWIASTPPNWNRALSLFRFGVNAIPSGAKILDARLSLYHSGGNDPDVPVTAHRITNGWSEQFVTWNNRNNAKPWDSSGGDFDTAVEATTLVGSATNTRYEWDISNLVQGWVDGTYSNHGVALRTLQPSMAGERFSTSDHADPAQHPRLSVTFACECGINCIVPQGAGGLLLVVDDKFNLQPAEEYRKMLFSDWGYNVNLVSDHEPQAQYTNGALVNDVVYIAESVDPTTLGAKLSAVPIGVINEEGLLNSTLGISNNAVISVGSAVNVTDTGHYISSLFAAGALDIYRAGMEQQVITTGAAPGLQPLADVGGNPTLATLEQGAMTTGGTAAAGRRVMLPVGRASGFNWDYLNNNGRLLVQRAIQWGTGITGAASPGYYRDELNSLVCDPAVDYAGSEGSLDWSAQLWAEVGESADPCSGGAKVVSDLGSNRLRIAAPDRGVERPVDLSAFSTAWLHFDYRRENLNSSTDMLSVSVSANGGSSWTEVAQFTGPANDAAYLGADIDISSYAGADTVIRFMALNTHTNGSEKVYIDDVQIDDTAAAPVIQNLLLVVVDPASLTPQEDLKKALIESWGYTVTLIDEADSQANFDTALAANDVVYITEDVDASTVGTRLVNATIGVVTEEDNLSDEFGLSDGIGWDTGVEIQVNDNTHYITQPFAIGNLTVFTATESLAYLTGNVAPDLQVLGRIPTGISLVSVDAGADLIAGRTAAGRRVLLPWGGNDFDLNNLNSDGRVLMRRALDWAAGTGSGGGGGGPPPTGGVVFEEFTDRKQGANGNILVIDKPPGTAAGDLLIAAVATDGNTSTTLTPPAGWTVLDVSQQGGAVTFGVWWKLAGAFEAADYSFTWGGGEKAYGMVMRFTGHDPASPINVSATNGGTSSAPTAPAVTTTVTDTMILRLGGFDDDDISIGNPGLSGHTPITMDKSSNGGQTASAGAGYLAQAAAGDSGTSDFLLSASEQYRTVTLAIAPAP